MILLIILGEKAMRIRKLELKDAPLMLEWMHDESVVCGLRGSFKEKTLDDCIAFINNAHMTEENIHLAIATDADEYMGTVSLKDIDRKEQSAEFAITVRKVLWAKGIRGMECVRLFRRHSKNMALIAYIGVFPHKMYVP